MVRKNIEILFRGFLQGVGLMLGAGATALLAVTVSGTVNGFASGELISASLVNENFASLKAGIEAMQFGSWDTSVAVDTTYQAATDGIVTCVTATSGSNLEARTGSSNPPTLLIGRIDRSTDSLQDFGSITMPVRKGDYWRVDRTHGSTGGCHWLPLGN